MKLMEPENEASEGLIGGASMASEPLGKFKKMREISLALLNDQQEGEEGGVIKKNPFPPS